MNDKKLLIVFDTGAFLAKYHLQIDPRRAEIFTVPHVIEEVHDKESYFALEIGLSIKRVIVLEPDRKSVNNVIEKAREIGEYVSLSKTDIEIAALALKLSRWGRVIVFTDDYALQNLLLHIGIPFKPLRTMGITLKRRYVIICKNCGYTSVKQDEKTCPICGAKLIKKKINTS